MLMSMGPKKTHNTKDKINIKSNVEIANVASDVVVMLHYLNNWE